MKYWLVQINVGTTYFRHSVCIQLEWITWRPSWFSLAVSWIPGQTVGTVNLKPAFLFFFFFFFFDVVLCSASTHSAETFSEILHWMLPQSWGTMAFLKILSCQVPRRIVSVWKHPPRTTLWYFALSVNVSSEWFMWDSFTPLTAQSPALFCSEREHFIAPLFWL